MGKAGTMSCPFLPINSCTSYHYLAEVENDIIPTLKIRKRPGQVVQLVEASSHQKVAGLVTSPGTYLGYGFDLHSGLI